MYFSNPFLHQHLYYLLQLLALQTINFLNYCSSLSLHFLICYLIQNPSKKKKGANRKMKITFNDGQELQIQQVTKQTDGALLIKTISASEDQLKTLFSDQTTTKRMSVSERDADTVVYENYTKLDAIVKYTAGILGVLMYREGEDPDSRIAALEARLKEAEEKNTDLQ